MKEITVSKTYIIEGYSFKKGSVISVLEENDNFDGLILDRDGKQIKQEDFEKMCEPIMSDLAKDNLINNGDVPQIM
jgi:hypothetical protein